MIIVILLVTAIIASIARDSSGSDIGLFRPDESAVISEETERFRQQEYDQREELPQAIVEFLPSIVTQYLSAGDFDGLDTKLAAMASQFKESKDDAIAIMDEIDGYRADIAYIKSISSLDNRPVTPWRFYNSEFLAAAIAYTPISMKY